MSGSYQVDCQCGSITLSLTGEPKVRGFCHCGDCRDLLGSPYHSVTAWEPDQVTVGGDPAALTEFQHPTKRMKRMFCARCGDTLFNTNSLDWRIVSQLLVRRCYDGGLPRPLQPQMHFFYRERIVDIDDDLPKHH